MPLNLKSFTDFVNLISGKFNKEVKEVDPSIQASFSSAVSSSTGAASVSLQEGIQDAINQAFYQTADDDFLTLIGAYDNTVAFDPQYAIGQASVGGILGTIINLGKSLIYNGNSYLTTLPSTVINYTGTLGLTFSAGIVTATTDINHTLATGLSVVITGATQTVYNGTFEITVLDENTFTYELIAGALGSDTGSYLSPYALLNIESVDTGIDKNIGSGGILTIDITNIDPNAVVGAGSIIGGSDGENMEDYRVRVGENHNITPGIATPPSMKASAKSISGNTRVFILRPLSGATGGTPGDAGYLPQPGETVIYILRDDWPSIVPSSAKLTETKDKLISDGHWPTFLDEGFLYVIAPTLTIVDFVFTSITPDTVTMQSAIRTQLVPFFEDNSTALGGTISLLETLNPFLRTIQDPSTGQLLTGFTYTSPSGDMVSASGEVLVRGSVTF